MTTSSFIPVAYPLASYHASAPALQEAVLGVLESGQYILGKQVALFEEEFAVYHGVAHCISVANGTDALALALQSAGIQPGDEVITVSHSAVATVAAIEHIGAVPVFCDIHPHTRCIDADKIEALLSPRTKAIVPVHIYGHPCDMPTIMDIAQRHALIVVEDCAQAHGAMIAGRKVGTYGHVSAFSFYPTKNLGCFGDGGAIITNDTTIAERAMMLRQYGWKTRYVSVIKGYNSRLDEMQAAILRVKLPRLDADNAQRSAIAHRYIAMIDMLNSEFPALPAQKKITPPAIDSAIYHVMHLFVVECDERDVLAEFLAQVGIGTGLHYPLAIHQQTAYNGHVCGDDTLPVTNQFYTRLLSLPMFPELSDENIERVCSGLRAWYHQE